MTALPIDISPVVSHALDAGKPVVALESTIITHGMPWPDNAAMAESVEQEIRDHGAEPATIAVIDGRLKIGLNANARDALAQVRNAMKLSRADLAFAIAAGRSGGTTVAATMMAAHMAGIAVFATGGIGGVHMGAETSFDISADLAELSRTPVVVVSAGAKAILDVPKTLEVLETEGVPVIGYRTDVMPAFWSPDSPWKAPLRLDSPAEIAAFETMRRRLGGHGGLLVANPVPAESGIPFPVMERHIAQAIAEGEARGISGKAVTPFLLSRIVELTGGDSLRTNIALVRNNARLAAGIAVALTAERSAADR